MGGSPISHDWILLLVRVVLGGIFVYYGWPKIKNLKSNAKVTAIDISEKSISYAKQRLDKFDNVTFITGDVDKSGYVSNKLSFKKTKMISLSYNIEVWNKEVYIYISISNQSSPPQSQ